MHLQIDDGVAGSVISDAASVTVNSRFGPDGTPEAALAHVQDVFDGLAVSVAPDRCGHRHPAAKRLLRHALQALRAGGVDVVITYGDPDFYGRVGFAPVSEETAPPPLPLSRPEGWLGLALTAPQLTPLPGPSVCVAALNDPQHW